MMMALPSASEQLIAAEEQAQGGPVARPTYPAACRAMTVLD